MVSHELKTPLASIAGFGAMIEKYPLSRQELESVAGRIRGEADRLGEMVRSFLDLERLGAGGWEGERVAVDLQALVGERCQLLSAAAADRGQEIVLDGSRPLTIRGVPELISRLVDNLVGNALKFSPEGTSVKLGLWEQEGAVVLSVADSGEGIPEESLPHLFERFYRVPGSGAGGSGLGLALVKEVADLHGARVGVQSESGRGSTFTVLFPAT
jgi:signal transduction histidine kinase